MVSFYRPQPVKAKIEEFELLCQELDLKGQGVCQKNGQICFVPGALPGELVRVRGVLGPKGQSKLTLLKIIEPSAERMAADCPQLECCGGCVLQHVPYELCLNSKIAGLKRLYSKTVKQELSEPDVVVKSPLLGYRRAARFAVRYDRGKLYLGFRKEGSHEVCDLEQCLTLTPRINAVLKDLRQTLTGLPQVGKIGHIEVLDSDGAVAISLRYTAEPQAEDLARLNEFARHTQTAVYLSTMQKSTSKSLTEGEEQVLQERCISGNAETVFLNCGTQQIRCTPGYFVQINKDVNSSLIKLVLDWLQPQAGVRILDLFCGLGNFSFPLAQTGAEVVGVDVGKQMIKSAQAYVAQCGLPASFYAANLDEEFELQPWAKQDYELVVLDPGRKGAARAYSYVRKKKIQKVLMISCNPTVGMRDLMIMLDGGYHLERWGVLDMFPRTAHVETVVLMSRVEK